jgi:hypothetical protein
VIVGGDWNQTPAGMEPELPSHHFDTKDLLFIEDDYPDKEWVWAYDSSLPTNRRLDIPYDPSVSLTTVIDFFLLSPNIKLHDVNTLDVGFKFSDHQPVHLKASLIPHP